VQRPVGGIRVDWGGEERRQFGRPRVVRETEPFASETHRQEFGSPSSRGPGRWPFKPVTRVRIPSGTFRSRCTHSHLHSTPRLRGRQVAVTCCGAGKSRTFAALNPSAVSWTYRLVVTRSACPRKACILKALTLSSLGRIERCDGGCGSSPVVLSRAAEGGENLRGAERMGASRVRLVTALR
jgi:hypothetical protein